MGRTSDIIIGLWQIKFWWEAMREFLIFNTQKRYENQKNFSNFLEIQQLFGTFLKSMATFRHLSATFLGFISNLWLSLPDWLTKKQHLVVCERESETLPSLGIFADMYHFKSSPKGIWKMHVCTWLVGGCGCAATFFSSAKNHRLPTPKGEFTSSETPLPTIITLRVI